MKFLATEHCQIKVNVSVIRHEEIRNSYIFLIGKLHRKEPCGKPKCGH